MEGNFHRTVSSAELKKMERDAQTSRDNEEVRVISSNRTIHQQSRVVKREDRSTTISPVPPVSAPSWTPRHSSTPVSDSEDSVQETVGPVDAAPSTVWIQEQSQGPPSGHPPPALGVPTAPQPARMEGWGSMTGPAQPFRAFGENPAASWAGPPFFSGMAPPFQVDPRWASFSGLARFAGPALGNYFYPPPVVPQVLYDPGLFAQANMTGQHT